MNVFRLCKVAASIVLAEASIFLVVGTAWAKHYETPDYQVALQNKTICSFINSNNVNIRNGPGDRYKVITKLNRGDSVRATHREGNWVAIAARTHGSAPNETSERLNGWVSNAYINGCSEDQFDRWRN